MRTVQLLPKDKKSDNQSNGHRGKNAYVGFSFSQLIVELNVEHCNVFEALTRIHVE